MEVAMHMHVCPTRTSVALVTNHHQRYNTLEHFLLSSWMTSLPSPEHKNSGSWPLQVKLTPALSFPHDAPYAQYHGRSLLPFTLSHLSGELLTAITPLRTCYRV